MSARPTLADLAFALRSLTALPVSSSGGSLGPATLFFPAVGLLVGAVVAAADEACARFAPPLRGVVAVLLLAGLGRFRALAALARVGAAVGRDRPTALRALAGAAGARAWQARAAGLALIAAAVALKLTALQTATPLRAWALLFAPMLGCWALVVVAFSARLARAGAPGPRFEPGITFREFGWASVFAAGACLVALEAIGLLAVLAAVAVAVPLRLLWHRWLGGIEEATFRATGEAAEVAVLLLFAALRIS